MATRNLLIARRRVHYKARGTWQHDNQIPMHEDADEHEGTYNNAIMNEGARAYAEFDRAPRQEDTIDA